MRDVVLFSGGLDSLATLFCVADMAALSKQAAPDALFVDSGSKYSEAEWRAIGVLKQRGLLPSGVAVSHVPLRDMALMEGGVNAYVPFRNLFLAATASSWVFQREQAPVRVWMGGIRDDKVSDKNPQAFAAMSACLSAIHPVPTEVLSPLWDFSKKQVVEQLLQKGDEGVACVRYSLSCYAPVSQRGCGKCPSCFRKFVACVSAGLPRSEEMFDAHPAHTALAVMYKLKFTSEAALEYDPERVSTTLSVLAQCGA